jgi:Zn-dependent protease
MYSQTIRFGTIFGIPVGINYSWFIVFVLITMSLTTQFTNMHPDWSFREHLFLGIATSMLFFVSVLLHELGHSVVALHYRIPVKAITLFIFGGVASIGSEPEKPMHEFWIAIAGPLVSAALGAMFYGLALFAHGTFEGVAALGTWLGMINLSLALFNLIPGFPLDGGRILRSIVWRFTGSFERATAVAGASGQFFSYAFIFFGIYLALTGNFFGGLWIGFIGWFLLNAAQGTSFQATLRSALRNLTARDVMNYDCSRISGSLTIADLVEHHLIRNGAPCSMVTDGDRFLGLVTLHEIKQIPRDQWHVTSVQSVMIPESDVWAASPETPLDIVLQTMNEENIRQVPVLDDEKLLGVIGRDRLLQIVQTRLELKS